MRMIDIIYKKRNGHALTKEEIDFFVKGVTEDTIPDYQTAALMMAVYFQKMNRTETVYLTEAMMRSGDMIDLSEIKGIKTDKHSTGGVGDKTTLVLGPMVAACGVPVAKMSGRGLGHTGGTIDKLESIKGFSADMSKEEFINNINEIKFAVAGQTSDIAPADKKLYALRDVTGTVDNLSLIASSIMSKKLAAGADAIVLDVKTGSGAFMKDIEDSFMLAQEMVDIGKQMNRKTIAVISDMDQPLGYAVGNSIEVKEAVETLMGKGPSDLETLCITLGSYMLLLSKQVKSVEEGEDKLKEVLHSGKAYEVFKKFVKKQGGDVKTVENLDLLPKSKGIIPFLSVQKGYVSKIQADLIGESALILGAGRERKESSVDLSVGIILNKKIQDFVEENEPLAYLHSNSAQKTNEAVKRLKNAFTVTAKKPNGRPLIFGIITKDSGK